jgi:hypothetical protein
MYYYLYGEAGEGPSYLGDWTIKGVLAEIMRQEFAHYAWNDSERSATLLDLHIGMPTGCERYPEDTGDDGYYYKARCPGAVDFELSLTAHVGQEARPALTRNLHLKTLVGGHFQRQARLAVLGFIADLADDGRIVPVAIQSPYY